MKKFTFVVLTIVLSLSTLAGCGPSSPSGKLVYFDPDESALKTIDVSPNSKPQVADGKDVYWDSAFSPDNKNLAVLKLVKKGEKSEYQLWIFDAQNLTTPKKVYSAPKDMNMDLSLLSVIWTDRPYLVKIANTGETEITVTLYSNKDDANLEVSKTFKMPGDYYMSPNKKTGQILVSLKDNNNVEQLALHNLFGNYISLPNLGGWVLGVSPDAKYIPHIAFYPYQDKACLKFYTIKDQKSLNIDCFKLEISTANKDVAWSPNSRYMAIKVNHVTGATIAYIFDMKDPEKPNLLANFAAEYIGDMVWSPDNNYLAFYAFYGGETSGLYISDHNGIAHQALATKVETPETTPVLLGWIK